MNPNIKRMKDSNKRFLVLIGMIVGAMLVSIVLRLIPKIPNIAPIAAIALFSAAYFKNKQHAFLVTLAALFASDLALQIQYWLGYSTYPGFYGSMPFVYAGFAAVVGVGFLLRNKVNALNLTGAILGGSLAFYLISNFGVWATSTMYPKSLMGLIECYVAGIPFIKWTLVGNFIYSFALFGGFEAITNNNKSWKLNPVKIKVEDNLID